MLRRMVLALAIANTGMLTLATVAPMPLLAEEAPKKLEHTKDSLDKVKKNVKEDKAVLVDVRTLKEWEAGHIKDAIFLPWAELQEHEDEKKVREQVPKDKIVYTYCEAGGRALMAGKILQKFGYDVRPLEPGHKELKAAGFESVK